MSCDPIHSAAAAPADPPQVPFGALTHYCGFDWARDSHQVAVVDKAGTLVLGMSFQDTAEGWALLGRKLSEIGGTVGVAVETSSGPAVERLLAMGRAVYPMNPKSAGRYRDRKNASGAKSDSLDALSFADALRTDGHAWRVLRPLDPLTHELRLLCRDEIALIEQRTALVNQLRAALHEYYPTALEAFEQWTLAAAWQFVIAFPTPAVLAAAGKRRWQKFLHAHKLYRTQTADKRLELFGRATEFAGLNPAVTAAKSLLAVALGEQLLTLQRQLDKYRQRIEKLFDDHPDHDLFGSLPGAGAKLAPRLLAEIGPDRDTFADPQNLQCYAGTAPVTKQSGRSRVVNVRRACNTVLRATVHLWADLSRSCCAWAQAYYRKKKEQGIGHAAALRCLGQRWLKILWTMWQERKCYDEARHMRDQVRHGSWVIALLPQPTAAAQA
jgi:transposase